MIGAVAVDLATESLLPPVLQDFVHRQFEGGITRFEIMLAAMGLCLLAALVLSYIGLFMLRKWGRLLFLLCNCLSLAFTVFTGPYVYTGLTLSFYTASSILIGLVIALSYFTPLFEENTSPRPPKAMAENLDPHHPLAGMPVPVLDPTTMSMTFHGAAEGITYGAETSTDLENWVTAGVTISAPNPAGMRTVTVNRDSGRRFLRLVVAD